MNDDWKKKARLGDLFSTAAGGTPSTTREEYYDGGTIPWLTSGEVRQGVIRASRAFITELGLKNSSAKVFPKDTVLVALYGATAGQVGILDFEAATNQAVFGVYPNKNFSPKFIFYFMLSQYELLISQAVGNAQPNLSGLKVKNSLVPCISLTEQRRIVGILDEAFAGIAVAKRNAQQNLQNARALFESHLESVDAEKALLGDLVDIRTGKLDANAAVEGGQFPFFTCSRDIYAIDHHAFDCEAILLAGNNAVGDFNVKHYKGKFNAYQRTYVITVNESSRILYRFLYFQMLKSLHQFKLQSVGAGTKFIKLGMIKGMQIALPSLSEQERIGSLLDSLRSETDRLAALYQQKLAALDELKKSLLARAFAGELASAAVA
jgi:type I restriction enzyme S subunit